MLCSANINCPDVYILNLDLPTVPDRIMRCTPTSQSNMRYLVRPGEEAGVLPQDICNANLILPQQCRSTNNDIACSTILSHIVRKCVAQVLRVKGLEEAV